MAKIVGRVSGYINNGKFVEIVYDNTFSMRKFCNNMTRHTVTLGRHGDFGPYGDFHQYGDFGPHGDFGPPQTLL